MNILTLLLPLFFTLTTQSPPHFINHLKQNNSNETITPPQPYFQITPPIPSTNITPSCSFNILNHTFVNATGRSVVAVNYTSPPTKCDWSVAVIDFQAYYKGVKNTGVAGIWLDGVELLRTSTAQTNENGSVWSVRKDVSRYSSVIKSVRNLTLSVVLENLGKDNNNNNDNDNNVVSGVFNVYNISVSFSFYNVNVGSFPLLFPSRESEPQPRSVSLNRKLISDKGYENEVKENLGRVMTTTSCPYATPASLIVPISGGLEKGNWFKIYCEFDKRIKNIKINQKAYKAVLELYISFHGDDEFWYMNPPDSYIKANNLPKSYANGAYREVLVTIDGKIVGTVIPFPVISPAGINPLFWNPVVSIGAFDLPSYNIDLTPYLGLLLDDKEHEIGIQVAGGVSFWLVDGNLHMWLDESNVQAIAEYGDPSMEVETECEFKGLDGEFEMKAERSLSTIRWVQSSNGVLKTKVTEVTKFKNKLRFKDYGTRKELEQTIKTKTKVKMTNNEGHTIGETVIEKKYPLNIIMETKQVSFEGGSLVKSSVIQGRSESFSDEISSKSMVLKHDLNCTGWMAVKGNSVISGFAENHQSYSYEDGYGDGGCYSRKVDVVGGEVIGDETTSVCVN